VSCMPQKLLSHSYINSKLRRLVASAIVNLQVSRRGSLYIFVIERPAKSLAETYWYPASKAIEMGLGLSDSPPGVLPSRSAKPQSDSPW